MDNYYDKNAKNFFDRTVNADMSQHYDVFLKFMPKNGHILDAGCGSGRDTQIFKSLGYEVTAIDGSLEMCKLASEYTKQEVLHMQFQEMTFKNRFDGIFASASLLHIPSDEMIIVLNRFNDALKDKDILYVSFKYGDFEGIRNGRYFNDMTEEKAIDLLEKANFKIIESLITSDIRKEREDEKWLNVLVKK